MTATIEDLLKEDVGVEDVTTNAIVPTDHRSGAKIVAKAAGVLAGQGFAKQVFLVLDRDIAYREDRKDGDVLSPGDIVATIEGTTRAILTAERVALNILQRLSGIATLTRVFVNAASGTKARILDTRKTTPGMRMMEKYAVTMGGGVNHRRDLTEMALIKENHIAVAGSIGRAVELVRARSGVPIEVEVRTMEELGQALETKVERIMLDNWDTASMRDAVALVAGRVPLEASGNMTVERVKEVAATGVDLISVGALTHSAGALDMSLLHEGVGT